MPSPYQESICRETALPCPAPEETALPSPYLSELVLFEIQTTRKSLTPMEAALTPVNEANTSALPLNLISALLLF